VGNTRALWPRFLAALGRDPGLRNATDPLDHYTESVVSKIIDALPMRASAHYAHTLGEGLVSMSRLAELSGLAYLGPAHLAIHPVHGPWFALRALIVLDAEAPPHPEPAPNLCSACDQPCVAAMNAALRPRAIDVARDWHEWLAVRDACPVGTESRYPDSQIRYHYTKDRGLLS